MLKKILKGFGPAAVYAGLVGVIIVGTVASRRADTANVEAKPFDYIAYNEMETFYSCESAGKEVVEEPEALEEPAFPKSEHLKVIGQMTEAIVKHKTKREGWVRCGKLVRPGDPEMRNWAMAWAYNLVRASWEYSDDFFGGFVMNPWGLAALTLHESGMDECALGPWPRDRAYKLGLLKESSRFISHNKQEVLLALYDPRMKRNFAKTGYDLGPCQRLTMFYIGKPDYSKIMSLGYGLDQCVVELKERAKRFNTDKPWGTWPGSPKDWYRWRIERQGRHLGVEI